MMGGAWMWSMVVVAGLIAGAGAVRAGEDETAVDAGRRYGQAQAAARFCPGGKLLAKVEELRARFHDADKAAFEAEAAKMAQAWDLTLGCQEGDQETGRPNLRCRQVKRLSCRQAWREIGPEGTAIPGLIEFRPE